MSTTKTSLGSSALGCIGIKTLKLIKTCVIITLLVKPVGQTMAQKGGEPQPVPKGFEGILAPWQTQGMDPAWSQLARKALQASWEIIKSDLFTEKQSLADIMSLKKASNQMRIAAKYGIGDLKSPHPLANKNEFFPLLIEPRLCRIYDYEVLFITVSNAKTNQLLVSSHHAVPTKTWRDMVASGQLQNYLTQKINAIFAQIAQASWTPLSNKSAMNLGLILKTEMTRQDESTAPCMMMLLEEYFAQDNSVPRALGGEHLALLKDITSDKTPLKRPSRYLHTLVTRREVKNRALPQNLTFEFELVEGVFAKQTQVRSSAVFQLAKPQASAELLQWRWQGDSPALEKVRPQVEQEASSLLKETRPQVLKIYGAWAYLDRGRAWGLKMGDRLTADNGQIKGHVVRYFGPEEELVSKKGLKVHEGAIVYIRKGQQDVKEGTIFEFDGTTYPTAWPPATPKAKQVP